MLERELKESVGLLNMPVRLRSLMSALLCFAALWTIPSAAADGQDATSPWVAT